MRFDLLFHLQRHAYGDEKARAADGEAPQSAVAEKILRDIRQNGDNAEKNRAGQNYPIDRVIEILSSLMSRPDPGNKAALFLQIFRDLVRMENNRRIKICKYKNQKKIKNKIKSAAGIENFIDKSGCTRQPLTRRINEKLSHQLRHYHD